MVALVADGPQSVPLLDPLLRELGAFPVQTMRRVISSHVFPNYVMQLLQQLDATFPRLAYVASGPQLAAMVSAATTSPVFDATELEPEELALALAKTFALDDTIMFGRVMLAQAAARSAILQADAQLNAPPLPPNGSLA
jgi:hypothetical protein